MESIFFSFHSNKKDLETENKAFYFLIIIFLFNSLLSTLQVVFFTEITNRSL